MQDYQMHSPPSSFQHLRPMDSFLLITEKKKCMTKIELEKEKKRETEQKRADKAYTMVMIINA